MTQTCSGLSATLGEPLAGTAGETRSWLLVEQPGPWGRFAFRESRLGPELGAAIEERCAAAGVNALLVKRPGRHAERGTRRVFAVSSRPGEAWTVALDVPDPQSILELDLEALGRGERPAAGEEARDPVFLVCTNGRRDACCARLGRPIASALHAGFPEATWECSHTGGHRFAGVMICLPDGLVYGRLDPEAALVAAEAYRQRRIEPTHFRGRTALTGPVQAADAYLRVHERIDGVDELRVEAALGGEVVLARADGSRYRIRVEQEEAAPPRPASCRDLDTPGKRPLVWALEAIEPA